MKVSDCIVEYLIDRGITDAFGYPGGMVTHLMDSFAKRADYIAAHVNYHEQGAAFAACGYAQASGKPGVAYATSGPGATNLITGICNAYFDSIPTIFITGQVNSNEAKGAYGVRQRGFQETDIVSIVKPITKYAAYVESADKLEECLNAAYCEAVSGRPGPALLDIPMDVLRADIQPVKSQAPKSEGKIDASEIAKVLSSELSKAKSPCVLIGNGVKISRCEDGVREFIDRIGIPAITSMIAFDALNGSPYNYGFIGAYGARAGNFIAAKSDLIVSIGSRMDVRQVGARRECFAPDANIIRFDVDKGELEYHVHANEIQFCADMNSVIDALSLVKVGNDFSSWISVCDEINGLLRRVDENNVSKMIEALSEAIPAGAVITTDVGQNQVWVAQSFRTKAGQKVLFSGGHGAMGYSLPAAIGAYYGSGKKPVVCICGDGGLQMNIQELQFIARESLPIKIVVINNNALGMIRHFQEMYFKGRCFQTKPEGGYTAPGFAQIAKAYGIKGRQVLSGDIPGDMFADNGPGLLEVLINEDTYVFPKLEFGKPSQDQEPLLDRALYERIMGMRIP